MPGEAKGGHTYIEAEGQSPGRVMPVEAEEETCTLKPRDEVLAIGCQVKPKGVKLKKDVDSMKPKGGDSGQIMKDYEPKSEVGVIHYVRVVRVLDKGQGSASEVNFRIAANVAPTGNIPPLPVDSHVADICHSVAGPPGEGSGAAIAAVTHSVTSGGRMGVGATISFHKATL